MKQLQADPGQYHADFGREWGDAVNFIKKY